MRYLIKQAPAFIILGILTKIPVTFEKESPTNILERKPSCSPTISRNGLYIPRKPSYNGTRFYHGTEKDFTQEKIFSKFRETK